jgi:hypothetical protein
MKNTINIILLLIIPYFLNAQKVDFKVSELKDSAKQFCFFPLFAGRSYYNVNTDKYVNSDSLSKFPDTLNLYINLDLCQNPQYHKRRLYPQTSNTILILKLQDTTKKGERYKLKCRLRMKDKGVKVSGFNFILDSSNILISNLGKLSGAEFSSPNWIGLPDDTSDYYFKNKKTITAFTNNFLVTNYIECCEWYTLETEVISLGGDYLLYFNLSGSPLMLDFRKKPSNFTISFDLDYIEITRISE